MKGLFYRSIFTVVYLTVNFFILTCMNSTFADEKLVFTDTYPFSGCKCVKVDNKFDPTNHPPICFLGSGGGIYIIDASYTDPRLLDIDTQYPNIANNKLRTGGFAWDITVAVKQDGDVKKHFVLCAAWRAGLAGWVIEENGSNLSMNENPDFKYPDPSVPDPDIIPARAVDYFFHNDILYIVVGCHDDWDVKNWEDGYLYLFRVTENQGSYTCETIGDPKYVEGGIFSVDVTTALQKSPGEEAAVFVAATKYGAKRFMIDLDIPDPNPKFVYQAKHPDPTTSNFFFARDVLVNEPDDPEVDPAVLFVASYEDLVHVLDVQAPGTLIAPVFPSYWEKAAGKAADAIALLKEVGEQPRLFVAFGPPLKDEYQFWGERDMPIPPKGSNETASGGLNVYDVSNPYVPSLLGYMTTSNQHPDNFGKEPLDITVLPKATGYDVGFMAMDPRGLGRMNTETYSSGPHEGEYKLTGLFNNFNEVDDPIPLGAVDDCIVYGNYLYTASETGIQVYDYGLIGLENLYGWSFDKGTILFSPTSGPEILYGATHKGAVLWDISDKEHPVGEGYLFWNRKDRCGFCYAIEYGAHRLLYTAQHNAAGGPEGSFTIHQVDDFTTVKDCENIGRYNGSEEEAPGQYVDVAVAESGGDHIVYVSFGPSNGTRDAGIHYFRVQIIVSNPPSTPVVQSINYLGTKLLQAPHGKGIRLTIQGNRLYAAFGPGGIAVYGIQNPANPTLIGARVIELYNEPLSALQIKPFTYGDRTLAYVTLLSGHLAVMDVSDGASIAGPYDLHETRFQAISLVFDPEDPDVHKIILADARGGGHRVTVPEFP